MIGYQYKSDMAKLLKCYLKEKKMTGFKFEKQARELERFDDYYFRAGYRGVKLTKSMTDAFIYGISYEKRSTHYKKEILLNGLAQFLIRQGHRVYVLPVKSKPTVRCVHIPYIFSEDELKDFFTAIDRFPKSDQTNRDSVDPILFRLLYGCGLRVSEAISLKIKDIDFETGTVTILGAKNGKDRLVPVAGSLVSRFRRLKEKLHTLSDSSTYFFISPRGSRLDKSTVYYRFRGYLLIAGISHTKQGPRVHDFRYPNLNKIQTFLKVAWY